MNTTLLHRASVRRYADQPVTDELLHELFTLASHTQTMGNLQLYSVVVTRDDEMKRQLAPLHFNQPMVTSAPVVLTVCADFCRTTRWAENRQAQPGFANELSFINAATDALLFTQTLCNLMDLRGLGYCYLGTTYYNPLGIIRLLQLPRLVMPVATLTVGWPAEQPAPSDRLSPEAFVHAEHYADYTPADIDRHYAAKEQLPENLDFIAVNGKQTLAQVFTDCRYTRADNEAFSDNLIEALRHQGFLRKVKSEE